MKFLPVLLLSGLISASLAFGQAHRIDDAALKNAGKSGDEWLTYGLDQGETRYSPLNQINTSNVSRLGLGMVLRSRRRRRQSGRHAAGVERHHLRHYELERGFRRRRAHGQRELALGSAGEPERGAGKICCGVVNRGVAIYQGKIIAPVIDGRLVALDAETGKPVWEARVGIFAGQLHAHDGAAHCEGQGHHRPGRLGVTRARINSPPSTRKPGKLAWRFYTVPGDPSKPFENPALKKAAETWSGEWWKLGGGGSVWDGMAYDPEADLFYVGTGNGGPWPEQLRAVERERQFVCGVDPRGEAGDR